MKKPVLACTMVMVALSLVGGFAGLSRAEQSYLIGTVWNAETMTAAPGLTVVLENDSHTFAAVTDEDGAYSFQGIPQGSYSIYIDAPKYYRLERQVSTDGNETAVVDIAAISVNIFDAKGKESTYFDSPSAFTGTWTGTWKSDMGGSGAIRLSLTSRSSKLKGTLKVTRTDCGTVTGPFSGSYNSGTNKVSGSGASNCQGSRLRVSIQGTKSGTTVRGRYTSYVDGSRYDWGTYVLHKR
jgi:hypothetical protein